ncbi:MAG: DUF2130 domain-containing protein, partial [Cytophagales bacterium]
MEKQILIHCPSCGHEFPIETALGNEIEQRLKLEFKSKLDKANKEFEIQKKALLEKEAEFEAKKEKARAEYKEQLAKDRQKYEEEFAIQRRKLEEQLAKDRQKFEEQSQKERQKLEEELRKSQQEEMSRMLELEKTKIAKQNEFEFDKLKLRVEMAEKEQEQLKKVALENEKLRIDLQNTKHEMQIELQKQLREKLATENENIRKKLEEEFELRNKDKEHEMASLKKQIDELKKRAEQGSMQAQGEVMELAIEESLKQIFPFDLVEEVGKGVKGADLIQTVKENGVVCGKIIYESKRTKHFSSDWVPKLKEDMMNAKADIAVLVTETMPKDMKILGSVDGVWICSYQEFKGLALALREG